MSEEIGGKRFTLAQGVTLGLAILIGGAVWRAAEKFSEIEDRMETKFVSRDVFTTEMAALRREADMRHDEVLRRIGTLETRIVPMEK